MLKKIVMLILFFSTSTYSSNLFSEIDLNNVESIVALLRIPTLAIKNKLSPESSKKYHHILNLSVDVLRLSSEVLSIINKNGELEFHKYDYIWAAYDGVRFVTHLVDLFNKPEDITQNSEDIKKLEGFLKTFHTGLIPFIEGLTALFASLKDRATIEDADFRLKCKSLNSAFRLFDNIIISKDKSPEQILYGVALGLSIIMSIKDLYGTNKIKEAFFKEETAHRQAEGALQRKALEEERVRKQVEEARLQKIRDEEHVRREAEEARKRKILEEEQASRQAEEARLQKIRDEEAACEWAEVEYRRAEETQLREKALGRPANDPSRLAWEEADRKQSEISVLDGKLVQIKAAIQTTALEERAVSFRQNIHANESWIPLDERMHPPRDSWLGRQFYAEKEAQRIQQIVSREFDRRMEENKFKEQATILQANRLDISHKLAEARTEFANARDEALRLSRENARN